MCGLGLVAGVAAAAAAALGAGLSEPGLPSGDSGTSEGEEATIRRGEAAVWDLVGLTAVGVGLDGEGDPCLQCVEEEDEGGGDSDDPGDGQALGVTEKVVGVLIPNLASNSLHTAKLRRTPSEPDKDPNPEQPAASEPLASSWQRSTKLPRRTGPHSLSRSECLCGRGLEVKL